MIQNKKMNRCLSERRRDRIDLILNLDSPYILKYYDMFLVNDSIHSFVMELCEVLNIQIDMSIHYINRINFEARRFGRSNSRVQVIIE